MIAAARVAAHLRSVAEAVHTAATGSRRRVAVGEMSFAVTETSIATALGLGADVVTVAVADLERCGVIRSERGGWAWNLGPELPTTAKAAPRHPGPKKSALEIGKCPRCRAAVLYGVYGGIDRVLDPQPLTDIAATAAEALGHVIFEVRGSESSQWRTAPQRRTERPDGAAWHRGHICDRPPPPDELTDAAVRRRAAKTFPDEPNF